MTKRMLIDATDPAETRVVVLGRNRVEEFDHEIRSKAQLKGNIYLAKVTRVEPSLQAAFVDYGGNRHGFLPFSEIHPDYYRIPIADREALLAEEAALKSTVEEEDEDEGLAEASAEEAERFEEPAEEDDEAADSAADEGFAAAAPQPLPVDALAEQDESTPSSAFEDVAAGEPDRDEVAQAPAEEEPVGEDVAVAGAVEAVEDAASAAPVEHIAVEEVAVEEAAIDEDTPPWEEPAPVVVKPARRSRKAAAAVEKPAAEKPAAEPPATPDEPAGDDGEGGSGRSMPHVANPGEQLSLTPEEAAAQPEQDPDAAPRTPASEESEGEESEGEESAGDEALADEETPAVAESGAEAAGNGNAVEEVETEEQVDVVGGDDVEDAARKRAKLLRRYKIQEVIKRGQVMLVQVAKEERGNKGAALTTYLSLPGRYCVLMPNTARGGGISRKIGSATDRRRLKAVLGDLSIPDGMAVIVRTAGSERSKAEIKRDYEYLVRLWSEIRDTTLASQAPALIYEEGNLIKRAIRDLYTSDMEEILVEGEESYKAAKAFMRSLMPSHAKKVQLYKDPAATLFLKYGVESQLAAMFDTTVQLRSGGYIVINVTEALVAIDVNSGKATRERHIEETALKTNVEAAEEVARQLRLRDLAGLIVIDFIDMEEQRHNREVERRLKEAMKLDRARIQLGRISPFGLLELSRQRLRPSLVETAMVICQHCAGTGRVYSPESAALHILRALAEEANRRAGGELVVTVPTKVALFFLNQKREQLTELEARYGLTLRVEADDRLHGLDHRIERPGQGSRDGRERDERREGREGRDNRENRDSRGDRRGRDRDRGDRDRGDRERGDRERNDRDRGERDRNDRGEHRHDHRGERRDHRPEREAPPVEAYEAESPDEETPEVETERSGRGERRQRGRRRRGDFPQQQQAAAPEAEEPVELDAAALEAAPEGESLSAPATTDEGEEERRRRRRRRGKRGGRRRGRRQDGSEVQAEGSNEDEGQDGAGQDDDDGDDEGPESWDDAAQSSGGPEAMTASDEEAREEWPIAAASPVEAPEPVAIEARETEPPAPVPPTAEPPTAEPPTAEPQAFEPPAPEPRAEAAPEPAPQPEPAPAPSFDVITESDPSQPKRKGWWNRLVR